MTSFSPALRSSPQPLTGSTLLLSPRSPFARRVRVALSRLGIPFQLQLLNPLDSPPELLEANPLGLVPVLKLRDGTTLVDSAVLLELLEDCTGQVWSSDLELRAQERQASTLAEGLMAAGVGFYLESLRSHPDPTWLRDHEEVVERTLRQITKASIQGAPWRAQGVIQQPGWDLAIALEYLDLRMPHIDWRKFDPALQKHLESCQEAAFFRETAPPPMPPVA